MQSTEFIHGVTAVAIERSELVIGGHVLDIIIKGEDGSEKTITLFSQDGDILEVEQ